MAGTSDAGKAKADRAKIRAALKAALRAAEKGRRERVRSWVTGTSDSSGDTSPDPNGLAMGNTEVPFGSPDPDLNHLTQVPSNGAPSVDYEGNGDDYEGEYKPNKQRDDPKPLYENFEIRMGDGWTVGDGSYNRQPMSKRRKLDAPYPHLINHTFRATSGLNGLQVSFDAPVNYSALDIACEHLRKSLHDDVWRQVLVPPPNGPDLWSGNLNDSNALYAKMELADHQDKTSKEYRFFTDMKAYQWIVWPLWVEDSFGLDFITVLIYSVQGNAAVEPARFDRVQHYSIIDPRRARYGTRSPGDPLSAPLRRDFPRTRTRRVEDALRIFLRSAGYNLDLVPLARYRRDHTTGTTVALTEDEIESPMTITHCSPMPEEEMTSGERCFATVKELLERITKWHLRPDESKAPARVFRHLRRWINPYQFRIEMAGINAWVLMATLGYNARIAVELVPPDDYPIVFNGDRRRTFPRNLRGPVDQPPFAPDDWRLPGQAPPRATVARS